MTSEQGLTPIDGSSTVSVRACPPSTTGQHVYTVIHVVASSMKIQSLPETSRQNESDLSGTLLAHQLRYLSIRYLFLATAVTDHVL